jgi:hypothetical protein
MSKEMEVDLETSDPILENGDIPQGEKRNGLEVYQLAPKRLDLALQLD